MSVAQPAQAAPARTGTILGGNSPFVVLLAPAPGPNCYDNADCLSWVAAGCPTAMVGVDPALHSSIVDVRRLAGSRKSRRFTIEGPLGFTGGGVAVQFWSRSCREIARIGGRPPWTWGGGGITDRAVFRIPRHARWMTVASADSATLTWRLN